MKTFCRNISRFCSSNVIVFACYFNNFSKLMRIYIITMTVIYSSKMSSYKGFGCFWKLLFRWRGSVYKLIWKDLAVYSAVYFSLSAVYRYILNKEHRRLFEHIALQTQYFTDMIPVAFLLGFYVSLVVKRWWDQFQQFSWIDSLSYYVSCYIIGNGKEERLLRRTIMRYVNLGGTLTYILKSPALEKRFPTLDHLIEAGMLTLNEKHILENIAPPHPKYSVPFIWAGKMVDQAFREEKIRDAHFAKVLIEEIGKLRLKCGDLLCFDVVDIPLVYTQVVTLAVYSFFATSLMSRQFLDPTMNYKNHEVDFVVPIFTYLQFIFYMGWLKVAEALIHPFGEDDDDFDIDWFIDRSYEVSYMLVDDANFESPKMAQHFAEDPSFKLLKDQEMITFQM